VRRLISGQVPCIHSGPSHRGYPPWDSNPDDARSERAGSAVGLEGHGAADRVRTGDPNVGNVVLYLLSYNRMEPAPRVELGPPPYHGGVLPLSPSRQSWDAWIRTTTAAVKARRPAVSRHPIGSLLPGSNRHLARYRRAALIQLRQGGGGVRSAGFEPATSGISGRSLYQIGVRAQTSLSADSNRGPRRYEGRALTV
jgi:hypothetical protein